MHGSSYMICANTVTLIVTMSYTSFPFDGTLLWISFLTFPLMYRSNEEFVLRPWRSEPLLLRNVSATPLQTFHLMLNVIKSCYILYYAYCNLLLYSMYCVFLLIVCTICIVPSSYAFLSTILFTSLCGYDKYTLILGHFDTSFSLTIHICCCY